MKQIWSFFSSIRLTLYLTYAIVIDAIIGSLYVMKEHAVFQDIDRSVLMEWWMQVGVGNIDRTWWMPVLVFLVFLFAVNTIVCSIDRLIPLLRFYLKEDAARVTPGGQDMSDEDPSLFRKRRSLSPFYPYIAHLGFIIALIGHLAGSIGGSRSYGNVAGEGGMFEVPGKKGLFLLLDRMDVEFSRYGYPEVMRGHVRLVQDGKVIKRKAVEVNSPLIYSGLAIYITNFQQAPDGRIYAAFDVIRDTGVWTLFTGLFIFSSGVLLSLFARKGGGELTALPADQDAGLSPEYRKVFIS